MTTIKTLISRSENFSRSTIYPILADCGLNEKLKNVFQKFRDPSTVKRS